MKKQALTWIVLLCSLLTFLSVPLRALDLTDIENPTVIEAFVDGLVYPLMKDNNSPSGTVSVVKDGKVVFAKGYGFQDIENQVRVGPAKTLFRPGSISKLFTWVAVMQMVEQGKLDLDADINIYLKKMQIKDTFPGQPITMRHIMTHTPGFEDGGLGYLGVRDIKDALPMAEAMEKFQPERVNPPGVQTAYSNYAVAVAGLIVANLSGMEFSDYIQKNILDILGMQNSSFKEPLPDALNKDMAIAYAFEGGRYVEKPFEILGSFAPAGAISATATDMAIFAQAILNGGQYAGKRILQEETIEQMLTRNFTHDDRMMGLALGFYEMEENGYRIIGHGGDTQFFHSDLSIDLVNNLALFSSFSGEGGGNVRDAFTPTFYDTFLPIDQTKVTPPADFSKRAEKYAGAYGFWRSNFSTIEKVGKLAGGIPVTVSDNNTLLLGGFSEYVEIGTNLFQNTDNFSKLAFQENDAGEITGFVIGGVPFMSTYKMSPLQDGNTFHLPLGLSLLLFVGVILRRVYQRSSFKLLASTEKSVANASFIVAVMNVLVFVIGGLVISTAGMDLFYEIPVSLKIWLVLPIMATIAAVYHAYNTFLVWRDDLCGGVWARVRYSIVTGTGLFMAWFYYFWNILGWQYLP